MVRAHQVVGGSLRCSVGTIGGVPIRLRESRIVGPKGPIYLVRRNVQEAETIALRARERFVVTPGFFEKAEGADDVGLHKGRRTGDRSVHMALRGEMKDGARLVLRQ